MKKKVFLISLVVLALLVGGYFITENSEAIFDLEGPTPKILFLLIVITEVVLAPVPGGLIAFLAAAKFGFWWSWPLQYLGNVIGATVVFFLARKYGRPFVEKVTKEDDRKKYDNLLHKHPYMLWIVYSLPIFPIDVISILNGFSNIKFKKFALIAFTGLVFYTGITAYVGASLGQYIPFLNTISLIVLGVFLVGAIYFIFNWKKNK